MVLAASLRQLQQYSSQQWVPKREKKRALSDRSQGRGCSRDAPEICAREPNYIIPKVPKYLTNPRLSLTSSIPHCPLPHVSDYCHLVIHIGFEWIVLCSLQCRTTSDSTTFMEHKLCCWNTCREWHSLTAVRRPPTLRRAGNMRALAGDGSPSLPSNLVYCHQ